MSIHNIAMNGGLVHSVMFHEPPELERGCAGFRYFGLDNAAEVVEWISSQVTTHDIDDFDAASDLERQAESRYREVVPDDHTLVRKFEKVLVERPEAFAP